MNMAKMDSLSDLEEDKMDFEEDQEAAEVLKNSQYSVK